MINKVSSSWFLGKCINPVSRVRMPDESDIAHFTLLYSYAYEQNINKGLNKDPQQEA